ncbi:WhiB family transcriptional regulator [Streptomyces sp. NPDC054841]
MNPPAGTTGLPIQTRRLQALVHAARQLCSSCPLWAECLRDSVTQSDPGGYAAATTQEDRRRMRRRLGIGNAQGDLGFPSDSGHRTVELDAVLDAFDAQQERWRDRSGRQPQHSRESRESTAHRVAERGQQHDNTHEVSMAAPAGERITFSLEDPALAIQKAVLGPLVHSTLPTLEITEQLAGMMAHAPSAGLSPQLLEAFREARRCLESWRATTGDDTPRRPADHGLTGSVSVELATSDPLAALRQDIFEPLVRRLAESLGRIEAITAVLVAAPGHTVPHGPELAAVHAALRDLGSQLEQYDAIAPLREDHFCGHDALQHDAHPRTDPLPRTDARFRPEAHPRPAASGTSAGSVIPLASWTAPSLRRAVELAVASLPGPFTGRDILLALPPGSYQDSAKSVSNALSAMVKSGRLRRVSRGTYTVAAQSTDAIAAHS